jgi:hypothetical protein
LFKSKDFNLLLLLTVVILAILGLDIYTSPTYAQKMQLFNSFIYFIAVLFIASVTLIVLWHGFRHFAVMLAIILGAIISLFGIKAGVIAVAMTYIIWGFTFSIEMLLAHNGVEGAIVWFKKHYTTKSFAVEYKVFYPMLLTMYIFLEVIPGILYKEAILYFNPKELYEAMYNELKKGS